MMEKRKMKKIIVCILALSMMFALAACGGDSAGSADDNNGDAIVGDQNENENANENESGNGGTIVVYFSATGHTKTVGDIIAQTLGADTYEIVPAEPYTSDDLDWTDEGSRVSGEHNDADMRPEIAGELPDLSGYDTVFIGYPIWWGQAPNIVWNFVETSAESLAGKTVIPFCTSSSSGLGSSGETLAGMAPDADWQDGQRFRSSASEDEVTEWVNDLNL